MYALNASKHNISTTIHQKLFKFKCLECFGDKLDDQDVNGSKSSVTVRFAIVRGNICFIKT